MTRLVGARVRRREQRPLLVGEATFVADITPAGTLHVAFVRSPHAHAHLLAVRAAHARKHPGVVEVLTAADLGRVPGPIPVRVHPHPQLEHFLQHALPVEKVRYVGEVVAAVVASDRYVAEDAAALVEVEYEPLEPVVDTNAAVEPGAPLLFEDAGTNVTMEYVVEYGDVEAAFAGAALVVSERFQTNRHSAIPMETRGLVATYDGETLTVWGPTKVLHANRRTLSELLGLPEEQIRLVEPSVGGGFGVRGEVYPEDLLLPLLAMRLGRPVKWIEDRGEHLVAANHSREQHHEAELALAADGTIVGLRSRFLLDNGAYVRTHGIRVGEIAAKSLPGPYRIPAFSGIVRQVVTNKTPAGTYRGPGRFETNFVRERLIDTAARRLDLDPVEIRHRNLIRPEEMPCEPGPRDWGEPILYETGDAPRLLDLAFEAVGRDELRRKERQPGRRVGIGVAAFMEDGGLGGLGSTPGEYARITLGKDGAITLYSGVAELGQGFKTVLAQVCAEELGVELDAITVVQGDTSAVESGGGTWASRGAILAGNATLAATRELKDRLRAEAAALLDTNADEVAVDGGRITGPRGSLTLAELATAAEVDLEASCMFTMPRMTYSPGAHAVVVEVDEETGLVTLLRQAVAYDVGRAINPLLVEAQIHGGIAQGVGGALLEHFVYDEGGQPLAASFMDYLLPTALEMAPEQEVVVVEDAPSPSNPLGVKAVGEVGPSSAGAAIANAVADALSDLDVQVNRLPLSPERVLGWILDARATGHESRIGS